MWPSRAASGRSPEVAQLNHWRPAAHAQQQRVLLAIKRKPVVVWMAGRALGSLLGGGRHSPYHAPHSSTSRSAPAGWLAALSGLSAHLWLDVSVHHPHSVAVVDSQDLQGAACTHAFQSAGLCSIAHPVAAIDRRDLKGPWGC